MNTATTALEIPLGRLEDEQLEFKSAAVLDHPEKIAREVVAMLNAEGGEVWIGLREEAGRAVEIEPISEAGAAREQLLDSLVDNLDPPPTSEELKFETVPVSQLTDLAKSSGHLLRLILKPSKAQKPYAYLQSNAWHFPIRVGNRLRPMKREEIFSARDSSDPEKARGNAADRLSQDRSEALESGKEGLWMGLSPFPSLSVDIQNPLIAELASEPGASGNRRTGWTFVRGFYDPESSTNSVSWGQPEGRAADPEFEIRGKLFDNGGARFFVSYEALQWKGEDLWPLALLEYPVSALRIMSQLYTELDRERTLDFHVLADIALVGVHDRGLRPGSPLSNPLFRKQRARDFEEGQDLLLTDPLIFSGDEVLDEPDRCAYRLIRYVYQGFGLGEEDIPEEFDRRTGRLILPE